MEGKKRREEPGVLYDLKGHVKGGQVHPQDEEHVKGSTEVL